LDYFLSFSTHWFSDIEVAIKSNMMKVYRV
jgi:hypothetical protein